jgi:hypothetical protein
MLWGGLLMFTSNFMALGFLSKQAHEWAAVLGRIMTNNSIGGNINIVSRNIFWLSFLAFYYLKKEYFLVEKEMQ